MTWRYEVQHLVSAVGLVRAGLALAVVPKLAVDASNASGIVVGPLRNPSISRTLGVVTRRGVPLSPAADELLALLRRHLGAAAEPLPRSGRSR